MHFSILMMVSSMKLVHLVSEMDLLTRPWQKSLDWDTCFLKEIVDGRERCWNILANFFFAQSYYYKLKCYFFKRCKIELIEKLTCEIQSCCLFLWTFIILHSGAFDWLEHGFECLSVFYIPIKLWKCELNHWHLKCLRTLPVDK